jgi:hypothetical protein
MAPLALTSVNKRRGEKDCGQARKEKSYSGKIEG